MNIYQVARQSVKSVLAHTFYPVCEDDFQDMLQAAALAIWQARPGEREAYYFEAGRTAARGWLVWWKYGAGRDKLFRKVNAIPNLQEPVSLEDIQHPVAQRVSRRAPLPDWMIAELREIFYGTRRKHGPKELAGIERDLVIVSGLVEERETIGIAHELGISRHMVNQYRQLLRKRLERYLAK